MRVLVTGASGFVGSMLVPRMCGDGHRVRAMGRDATRVREALARSTATTRGVEVVSADALTGVGLREALDGIDLAYYLIHSMERTSSATSPFEQRERTAAHNFAEEAARAGVGRIVYLGGLVPRWQHGARSASADAARASSRHLASREEVERILLASVHDSIALRTSIVIGARSRSFRLLVRLVERLPLLALPAWRDFRTQPIDARDVIAMLAACASAELPKRALELGGPEVLSYGEMLQRIAELMLVGRPSVPIGVSLTPLTARVAAAIAGEDPELVLALMEGLKGDLLPADDDAAELLQIRLHSFDAAVEHALGEWEQTERLAAR